MDHARDRAKGHVTLVGAGPGAADLLTLRALRAIEAADVLVHDDLVPADILMLAPRARLIAAGKRKGRHSMPQTRINALLVALGRRGLRVVRLKAGDPLVFGRAGEEIAALRAAGIAHDIVPGVTSALAAAADARVPLTLRGVASHLVFATGHGADGALPPGIEALAREGATLALYMARSVADGVAARLLAGGLPASTPALAVEQAGRDTRRLFAGALADLPALAARDDLAGPVLILVGPAVAHGDLAQAEPFLADLLAAAA
jgi:uroporphyrin-III C-methyltransferase/precorrin-2 dehydrogenase/sirohydrochlorin ferrochelatase